MLASSDTRAPHPVRFDSYPARETDLACSCADN